MSAPTIRIYDDGSSRLYIRWFCRDSALWHQILESFKSRFPSHHDRSYSARTRTWSVPRSRYGRLAEWVDDWFGSDCQEWLDDEPGDASYGRTYSHERTSYGAYQQQSSTGSIEAAFKELHLLADAPAWAAEAVYKAAVKIHHPDAGGDDQAMVRVNLAMERIREHQQQERKAS